MANPNEPIMLEFSPEMRVQLKSTDDLAKRSQEELEKALGYVQTMAEKVQAAVQKISDANKPSELSISFGIKCGGAAGVVFANLSAEASINVTLKWTKK